jgi:hypothetical protein
MDLGFLLLQPRTPSTWTCKDFVGSIERLIGVRCQVPTDPSLDASRKAGKLAR